MKPCEIMRGPAETIDDDENHHLKGCWGTRQWGSCHLRVEMLITKGKMYLCNREINAVIKLSPEVSLVRWPVCFPGRRMRHTTSFSCWNCFTWLQTSWCKYQYIENTWSRETGWIAPWRNNWTKHGISAIQGDWSPGEKKIRVKKQKTGWRFALRVNNSQT